MQFTKRGSLFVPDYRRQWIIPPSPGRDIPRYRRYLEERRRERQRFGLAVAYISDADKQDVASGNDTFASFAVSGTNPAIIICAAIYTSTVSSITLSAGLTGGTPYQVKAQVGSNTHVEIWAIPAPSGTGTITVAYTASVNHQCCAVLMQGVDQTTPCPIGDAAGVTGAVGNGSPLSVTPSNLTANDAVIYMGSNTAGDAPHASTGTEIFFGNSTNINACVGYHLGTGAVTVTWGIDGGVNDSVAGVRVQAVSSGGADTPSVTDAITIGESATPNLRSFINVTEMRGLQFA